MVFSIQDVILKWLSGDYPLAEAQVLRGVFALPFILVLVRYDGGWRALVSRRYRLLLGRSALMLTSYTCYYLSLPALPLAEVVAITFTVPLIIAALAGVLLKEHVSLRRWLAILVGFAGVLIIVQPGGGVMEWAALLPLVGAFTYALSQIIARRLGPTETTSVMAFYQNTVYLVGGLVLGALLGHGAFQGQGHPSIEFFVRAWTVPTALDFLLLSACGPISAAGVWLLTHAYRLAEANRVAFFEYSGLVWAILWGYLVWHDVPRLTTVLGAAIVVGAGIYMTRQLRAGD
jgi:drug/metabolite transporter (DMT)-like permease